MSTIPGGFSTLPADATGHTVGVQANPDRLAELAQLVADGHLTAVVGKRMGLGAAAEALSLAVTAGRHRVVILP